MSIITTTCVSEDLSHWKYHAHLSYSTCLSLLGKMSSPITLAQKLKGKMYPAH